MSTIEHAVPQGGGASAFRSPFVRRIRAGLLIVLALWSAWWAQSAFAMARAHSSIGRGTAGAIEAHEIFELVFVTSHCMVRWAPVALALLVLWLGAGRLERRRNVRPAH